jgi:hypothetical protein
VKRELIEFHPPEGGEEKVAKKSIFENGCKRKKKLIISELDKREKDKNESGLGSQPLIVSRASFVQFNCNASSVTIH